MHLEATPPPPVDLPFDQDHRLAAIGKLQYQEASRRRWTYCFGERLRKALARLPGRDDSSRTQAQLAILFDGRIDLKPKTVESDLTRLAQGHGDTLRKWFISKQDRLPELARVLDCRPDDLVRDLLACAEALEPAPEADDWHPLFPNVPRARIELSRPLLMREERGWHPRSIAEIALEVHNRHAPGVVWIDGRPGTGRKTALRQLHAALEALSSRAGTGADGETARRTESPTGSGETSAASRPRAIRIVLEPAADEDFSPDDITLATGDVRPATLPADTLSLETSSWSRSDTRELALSLCGPDSPLRERWCHNLQRLAERLEAEPELAGPLETAEEAITFLEGCARRGVPQSAGEIRRHLTDAAWERLVELSPAWKALGEQVLERFFAGLWLEAPGLPWTRIRQEEACRRLELACGSISRPDPLRARIDGLLEELRHAPPEKRRLEVLDELRWLVSTREGVYLLDDLRRAGILTVTADVVSVAAARPALFWAARAVGAGRVAAPDWTGLVDPAWGDFMEELAVAGMTGGELIRFLETLPSEAALDRAGLIIRFAAVSSSEVPPAALVGAWATTLWRRAHQLLDGPIWSALAQVDSPLDAALRRVSERYAALLPALSPTVTGGDPPEALRIEGPGGASWLDPLSLLERYVDPAALAVGRGWGAVGFAPREGSAGAPLLELWRRFDPARRERAAAGSAPVSQDWLEAETERQRVLGPRQRLVELAPRQTMPAYLPIALLHRAGHAVDEAQVVKGLERAAAGADRVARRILTGRVVSADWFRTVPPSPLVGLRWIGVDGPLDLELWEAFHWLLHRLWPRDSDHPDLSRLPDEPVLEPILDALERLNALDSRWIEAWLKVALSPLARMPAELEGGPLASSHLALRAAERLGRLDLLEALAALPVRWAQELALRPHAWGPRWVSLFAGDGPLDRPLRDEEALAGLVRRPLSLEVTFSDGRSLRPMRAPRTAPACSGSRPGWSDSPVLWKTGADPRGDGSTPLMPLLTTLVRWMERLERSAERAAIALSRLGRRDALRERYRRREHWPFSRELLEPVFRLELLANAFTTELIDLLAAPPPVEACRARLETHPLPDDESDRRSEARALIQLAAHRYGLEPLTLALSTLESLASHPDPLDWSPALLEWLEALGQVTWERRSQPENRASNLLFRLKRGQYRLEPDGRFRRLRREIEARLHPEGPYGSSFSSPAIRRRAVGEMLSAGDLEPLDDWLRLSAEADRAGREVCFPLDMLALAKESPPLLRVLLARCEELPGTSSARRELEAMRPAPAAGSNPRTDDAASSSRASGLTPDWWLEYLEEHTPGRARLELICGHHAHFAPERVLAELRVWLEEPAPLAGGRWFGGRRWFTGERGPRGEGGVENCLLELTRVWPATAPAWLRAGVRRLWSEALQLPSAQRGADHPDQTALEGGSLFGTSPALPFPLAEIAVLLERLGDDDLILEAFDHPPAPRPDDEARLPDGVTRPMLMRWWLLPRKVAGLSIEALGRLEPDHAWMKLYLFRARLDRRDPRVVEALCAELEAALAGGLEGFPPGWEWFHGLLARALALWPEEVTRWLELRVDDPAVLRVRLLELAASLEPLLPSSVEGDTPVMRRVLARLRRLVRRLALEVGGFVETGDFDPCCSSSGRQVAFAGDTTP